MTGGSKEIEIGTVQDAITLFTYPNKQSADQTLEATIEHWFNQTLKRDSLQNVIKCQAKARGSTMMVLELHGRTEDAQVAIETYATILPKFFKAGLKAQKSIQKVKEDKRWDPRDKNWRFFMPLGLPMANNKSLQFFHYPPQKMLELQDYLDDPVPHRIEDLLTVCGVADRAHAQAFECIVDGAPIAAPDDEGSAKSDDPKWGNIPIQYFQEYQKDMVTALLKPHPKHLGYTIPIVVFGSHPREIFAMQFIEGQDNLGVNEVHVIEVLKGLKTPVVGANHPYRFYAQAQLPVSKEDPDPYRKVGNGRLNMEACKGLSKVMQQDLATTSWMLKMIEDPSQDPKDLMKNELEYWSENADAQNTVCALTRSQATLFYTDEEEILFTYVLGLDAARAECGKHGNETCSFCT